MANQISIVIQAQDNASKKIRELGGEIDRTGKELEQAGKRVGGLREHLATLAAVAVTAGLATRGLIGFMGTSVSAANDLQAALIGLNTIANSFGVNADRAKVAAQELAEDGLMTVTDSATGLKNLLSSGFSLDQAITLMKRFKDSAAFGRQSSLSFGQAISSATEGIKNGNSILVDNAGVTKNLSVMLKEAGISVTELGNASSDATVRQAIFNGILKETNAQAGDAARLADSAAGKQAKWTAQNQVLMQNIGTSLQPALLRLLETVTPIIVAVSGWVEKNPELAAGILLTATASMGLITAINGIAGAVTALGPVFTLFKVGGVAAIGGVQTAAGALSAFLSIPMIMPAIGVAAALGAIALVAEAIASVQRAMDALNQARANEAANQASGQQLRDVANRKYRAGQIDINEYNRLMSVANGGSGAKIQNVNGGTWTTGYSVGTNYSVGGDVLVGENGPERVRLPAGSQVAPAWQSRQPATQSSSPTVIVQNYNSYNERDDNRFFRDIGFALAAAS